MILFNITHIVSDQKVNQYVQWLQNEFIPLIEKSLYFSEIKLFEIVDSPNEGHSFSLQLFTNQLAHIESFKSSLFPLLQAQLQGEFQGHLLIFDTTMKHLRH